MIRIQRLFRFISYMILIVILLAGSSADAVNDAQEFTVRRIGQMISYKENYFEIQAPENGLFAVTIRDEFHIYRVIEENIEKGISRIEWDGCAYNEEKLSTQYYTFDFSLQGISGKEYRFQFRSPVVDHAQHLQFVLPSGDTVYLEEDDEWFVEIKTVLGGILALELIPEGSDKPAGVFRITLHQGRVEHYTFRQIVGKNKPEPGKYTVQVYDNTEASVKCSFPLCVKSGSPEKEAVLPTGEIMPSAEATDSEIWDIMMKPSVVVNKDALQHQNVYAEPDEKSAVLGTLHGETQCLSVLDVNEAWAKIGAWNHEEGAYVEGWVPYRILKIVQPNPDYGMLIDKKNQTLAVFYKGERIETLLISTGRMEKNKFFQETSAGCYLTGLHRVDFSMQGNKYDFVIQYDGGNLLHQIPYTSNGEKNFTMGRAYLGSKASHGCVRIQDEPGCQNGINAYWIWTHVPYHTKLIILDDSEEREKAKCLLSEEILPEINADHTFSEESENGDVVALTFGGDVITGSTEDLFGYPKTFGAFFQQFGARYPFSGLYDLLSEDDMTCISLECVLKENGKNENYSASVRYRGLPEYAEIFSEGSVELICFANEHIYDYKEEGYQSTIAALDKANIWIGKNHLITIRIKGHLFGFGACTEADYLENPHVIEEDIRILQEACCEYIIYQCHWGKNGDGHHSSLQEAMARACERAGADLVVGHHPNTVQGIDFINSMPVIYSMGNLLSGGSFRVDTYETILVRAVFYPGSEKTKPEIRIIPVLSSSKASEKNNDYRPVPATDEDKTRIYHLIQKDTPFSIASYEY